MQERADGLTPIGAVFRPCRPIAALASEPERMVFLYSYRISPLPAPRCGLYRGPIRSWKTRRGWSEHARIPGVLHITFVEDKEFQLQAVRFRALDNRAKSASGMIPGVWLG